MLDASTLTNGFRSDRGTAINACVECCDRSVGYNRVALQWANESGQRANSTFEQLESRSTLVANLLTQDGVQPGDVVTEMLRRRPLNA